MKVISGRSLYFSFLLSSLLILSSCAKSTRTITPLTHSDRSNVRKIAIFVEADEELDASVGEPEGFALAAIVSVGVGWLLCLYISALG